jgi:hypothetical protein
MKAVLLEWEHPFALGNRPKAWAKGIRGGRYGDIGGMEEGRESQLDLCITMLLGIRRVHRELCLDNEGPGAAVAAGRGPVPRAVGNTSARYHPS